MSPTFDLTFSSEESPSPSKHIVDNDFIDDDFRLSAIKQDAEKLSLQQLKVDKEIAATQKGEDLGLGILRTIPDKPPPPYVPPVPVKPEKLVPPKVLHDAIEKTLKHSAERKNNFTRSIMVIVMYAAMSPFLEKFDSSVNLKLQVVNDKAIDAPKAKVNDIISDTQNH